ncbi:MAG: EAL domain-containing protein [Hahellaceae bacterium]|nr:EAL domain-containing protein [Hahellaceae bacterium]MCP5170554.1 EAL domain-containing protein [Hahellaceae bacterium]
MPLAEEKNRPPHESGLATVEPRTPAHPGKPNYREDDHQQWYIAPLVVALLLLGLSLHSLIHLIDDPFVIALIETSLALIIGYGFFRYAKKRLRNRAIASEKEALIQHLDQSRQRTEILNTQLVQEMEQRIHAEQELVNYKDALEQQVTQRTGDLQESNLRLNQEIQLRKNISDALLKSQTRLAQAIEASHLGLWDWDLASGQIYQSPFHEAFSERELSSEEFIAHLKRIIHPQDYDRTRKAMADYLRNKTDNYQIQYRVKDPARGWIWIEDCGKAIKQDRDRKIQRMLGTRRDVTEEKHHSEQLQLAKTVFDYAAEGIFVLDDQFRFLSVNPAYELITGYTREDLTGRSMIALSGIQRKQEVFQHIRHTLTTVASWQGELLERHKNGNYFPLWLQLNAIQGERNEIHSHVGIITDLTSRRESDKKLQYLLNYDDLTGLANRNLFHDRLHHALSKAREEGTSVTLLHINIDRFKQVNETFGHKAADHLLTQVAHRLEHSAQFTDTLARLGSDEFALIIHGDKASPLETFAQMLLNQLSQPFRLGQHELLISCSMGIARFPEDANDLPPLVHAAAVATKHARYLGGNNWQRYHEQLKQASHHRLKLENELRKALKQKELEVYYQPKANAQSGQLVGAEALVRWHHPERGEIPPSEFVQIAEESGLIFEIGAFVLRQACHQTQCWLTEGLGPFSIAVNISAHQLRHQKLITTVKEVLLETQLPPGCLELELTETVMAENISSSTDLLRQLSSLGVKLAVDDFGTGYSSLAYLKRFPIDSLKIDRSFIQDITEKPEDASITRAIIALGKSLGLQLIAEGIETEKQRMFLMSQGCDLLQGYLISKPLNADEMSQMLEQRDPVFKPYTKEKTQ